MIAPLADNPASDHVTASEHAAPDAVASPRRARRHRPAWLREPLLHFVVLGGVLFGADHFLADRGADPHTIIVGADVDGEAHETFKATRGREPNAQELEALHRVWLDNEVLYREGLALQLDKGDSAIRERVIFKALTMIDSNVHVPTADDKVLRAWFDGHRDKYDEPARYSFEDAALSGDSSEAAVRKFVTALNSGVPGDAKAGLRVFKDRPQASLVESYGPEFVKTLARAQPDTWQAVRTGDGWRAIRIDAITPAKPAVFEVVRGMVQHDWIDATAAEQRTAAVRALAKKYTIKYEPPTRDDLE
ncbi:MAG TPA: peptidylprolyl isomerase [Kofleriaceae bacterium]